MRSTPSSATAYSRLACAAGPAVFPAMRITNRFPAGWSKTTDGGTRASEQARIAARGAWSGGRAPALAIEAIVASARWWPVRSAFHDESDMGRLPIELLAVQKW